MDLPDAIGAIGVSEEIDRGNRFGTGIVEFPAENVTVGIAGVECGERTEASPQLVPRTTGGERIDLRIEIEVDALVGMDMTVVSAEQFAEISNIPTENHPILR